MPTQVYKCSIHGEYDVITSFRDDIKETLLCRYLECRKTAKHIIKPPAGIKVSRTWNEKANEYQRDTYTQAKAQITNSYNEEAERTGKSPRKITEEAVQVAAESIDRREKNPAPTDTQRHAILANKVKKAKKNEK
jgi:hypothetical protein